ncbi:MAG: response regulator [Defluviitaleaceae bacterium]|nr:response regulator [Defluviitaleaceae bacterium]
MRTDGGYFKRIKSLFLPYQANVDAIHTGINKYVDKIDMETERLENSYNNDNMAEFNSVLMNIQQMLTTVCAKRHEAYTVTLMRSSRSGKNEYSNKVLQQAMADFLLLSIEMQKAQNLPDSAYKSNEVEDAEEAARNLTAIIQLIDAQDYDRAISLASDISNRGINLMQIASDLQKGHYTNAKDKATVMRSEYSDRVYRTSPNVSTKTVLAVDDRPEILTTVNAALSGHYRTLGAPSGRVALDITSTQTIGLFILDIDMPEMDGFQLASQIRGTRDHKDTPIIFLTANSSRERIQKAIRLGISDFIVKPAYNETLLSKVKKYLE